MLYFISFILIIVGVIIYSVKAPPSQAVATETTSSKDVTENDALIASRSGGDTADSVSIDVVTGTDVNACANLPDQNLYKNIDSLSVDQQR